MQMQGVRTLHTHHTSQQVAACTNNSLCSHENPDGQSTGHTCTLNRRLLTAATITGCCQQQHPSDGTATATKPMICSAQVKGTLGAVPDS
jgi:hypothetical protein